MTEWYDENFRDRTRFGLRTRGTLYDQNSEFQHIEVIDTIELGHALVIDGVFMTSEKDEHYYHEMLVHPALVTAPSVAQVLIIGGGDGGTAKRVLQHRDVQRVVMVEIDGSVVDASKLYLPGLGAWDDPRLELRIGDGIEFVNHGEPAAFDVVLLDGTDPVGPGKGLFNDSFYRGVHRVLAPGGVFALQSETPFYMREVFLDIIGTLRGVFNRVHPYFGPAPIYASGVWSWTYATDTADPMAIDAGRVEAIEPACRYYNRDIHRGAFALPSDLARELASL